MGVGGLGPDWRPDFPIVIATMPANARQRKIALGAFVVLVVIIAITIPFANIQLAPVDAFLPVIQTVMCMADFLAAMILFAQYSVQPQRAVLALATGYMFSGLFAFLQTLAFPGAYATAGLIGDGLNSAGWFFALQQSAFPLAVIFYTLSKAKREAANRSDPTTGVIIGATIVCVAVATAGSTWVATKGAAYLPNLYENAIRQAGACHKCREIRRAVNVTWAGDSELGPPNRPRHTYTLGDCVAGDRWTPGKRS